MKCIIVCLIVCASVDLFADACMAGDPGSSRPTDPEVWCERGQLRKIDGRCLVACCNQDKTNEVLVTEKANLFINGNGGHYEYVYPNGHRCLGQNWRLGPVNPPPDIYTYV